jgi:flagellin
MFIQDEVDALKAEINRVARTTVFNDQFILDGSYADRTMQIGAEEGQVINFGVDDTSSDSLGAFSILFRPNATSAQNAYSNTAGHQLRGQNSAAAASYAAATTALSALVNAAADYTISGQFGTKTAFVDGGASSKEAAFAFNQISGETGVTASAITKAQMHTLATAGTLTFDLFGKNDVGLVATTGGTGAKVQATVSSTTDLTNLKDAINEHSGVTGITASLSSDRAQINLVQDEGYDIVIADFLNSAGTGGTIQVANLLVGNEGTEDRASNQTLGGATTSDSIGIMGQISLSSDRGFTVLSGNAANHLSATQVTHRAAQQTVSSINMLSKLGSTEAISVIDAAIQQVSDQRSEMGAINNRLESTIENLNNIIVNTEAAVSRIMDADYADETTKLSKSQVLTQAATAMLAQANQQPQGILRLLGAA